MLFHLHASERERERKNHRIFRLIDTKLNENVCCECIGYLSVSDT